MYQNGFLSDIIAFGDIMPQLFDIVATCWDQSFEAMHVVRKRCKQSCFSTVYKLCLAEHYDAMPLLYHDVLQLC